MIKKENECRQKHVQWAIRYDEEPKQREKTPAASNKIIM